MPIEIQWLGHAGFRISGPSGLVYIDPWKLSTGGADADVVIVSHSHHDHYSPQDVAKVSKATTTVLGPPDVIAKLPSGRAIVPGESVTIGRIVIEATPAYNVGKKFHPKENGWIGVVISMDAARIYYAGDTDLIDEMSALERVDVALLPVGGTYTMDAAEAALACERIACKAVIPYHWGDIVGTAADAEAFAEAVSCCEATVLDPGESMTL